MANYRPHPEDFSSGSGTNCWINSTSAYPVMYPFNANPPFVSDYGPIPAPGNALGHHTQLGFGSSAPFYPLHHPPGRVPLPVFTPPGVPANRAGANIYREQNGMGRPPAAYVPYPLPPEHGNIQPQDSSNPSTATAPPAEGLPVEDATRQTRLVKVAFEDGIFRERPEDPYTRMWLDQDKGVWDQSAKKSFWLPSGFIYEGKTTNMKPNYHIVSDSDGTMGVLSEREAENLQKLIRRGGQKAKDLCERTAHPKKPTQKQVEKMIHTWEKVWKMHYMGRNFTEGTPPWGPSFDFHTKKGILFTLGAGRLVRLIDEDWPNNVMKSGYMGLGRIIYDETGEAAWFCGPTREEFPKMKQRKSGNCGRCRRQAASDGETSDDTGKSNGHRIGQLEHSPSSVADAHHQKTRATKDLGRRNLANRSKRKQATPSSSEADSSSSPDDDDDDDDEFDDDFRA